MKLYLMRHCEPQPGEREDAARGLTAEGVWQANEMADFLQRQIGRADIIITSPFQRAALTAAIIGEKLGTPVEASTMLQPDGNPEHMWEEVVRIAQQATEVLVVGHHPSLNDFINWLCGAQTVERHFKHGSIAHVHDDNLVWMVTPNMVARDKIQQEIEESAAALAVALHEHLLRPDRAAVLDPLIGKLRFATAERFRKQHRYIADSRHYPVSAIVQTYDPKFHKVYNATTAKAYTAGAKHAQGMLPASIAEAEGDSKKRPLPFLPGPTRTAETLEMELDSTSIDRLSAVLNAARSTDQPPLSFDEIAAQVKELFQKWATGAPDEVSRAETVAVNEISKAYHQGMADLAAQWRGGNGPIEKTWSVQPDACEAICVPNADEGWIDSEAPFTSGDFEPPGHPNCRCSLEYRSSQEISPA